MDGLITAMKLGIGLLHEGHPKLVRISAMTVKRGLRLRVVRDAGVNDHILPSSILEKLEDREAIFKPVINYKVLEEFTMS
jgi:hypothetical protein